MPISHRNPATILKGFRDKITNRTNINVFSGDSKTRVLVDAFNEEVIALREEQIAAYYADKISSASGRALDEIGDKLGLQRITSRHAKIDFTERSLAFYVESGTFGTINSATNINLTSATLVTSDPNSNELNSSVTYQLTQDFPLIASESLQYVSARATVIGTDSNVGTGVLRRHDFTNYTDSANRTLKAINFYPVLNGVNDEPDDMYRFRLANHYNRMMTNNETRMKLTALDLPGIVNTRVEPSYFGIGTAAVFALGPENQSNTSLVEGLQQRLEQWKLPGGQYISTPATEVKFDFELEITTNKALTLNQIAKLKADLNKGFLAYFRTLSIGSNVDLHVLANTVQKRILTTAVFAQRGGDRVFKRVYIRKGYAGGVVDERSRLVGTVYALDRDEFASLGTLAIEVT